MNNQSQKSASEQFAEEVLSRAKPRVQPSQQIADDVRAAAHAEWQKLISRRRRRRTGFAIAASLVLAMTLIGVALYETPAEPVQVASISRMQGENNHWRNSDDAALTPLSTQQVVLSGQSVATGAKSGVALTIGSVASLRIDQRSTVRFIDEKRVELSRGRLYFDSAGDASVHLVVVTPLGEVEHRGTQFLVELDNNRLGVSVRDGEVSVADELGNQERLGRGEQVLVDGGGKFTRGVVSTYGGPWTWVEKLAMPPKPSSLRIEDYLTWFAGETGRTVSYVDEDAKDATRDRPKVPLDTARMSPETVLHSVLTTAGLKYELKGDVLEVRSGQP